MVKIAHRINSPGSLEMVEMNYGIELDVRYHQNDLILSHDPFGHHEKEITLFEDILKNYGSRGTLVVNLKTEGIEDRCAELLAKYGIDNWYFLDMSMPYFILYSHGIYKTPFPAQNMCVRYSKYEPIEYALAYQGVASHVWVDPFGDKAVLSAHTSDVLREAGFKITLVSPELHGQKLDETTVQYFSDKIDMVCTKQPEMW